MLQLLRFMIAVAGVTVNHDGRGGTAPDLLVWDQGGPKKARKLDISVNVDLAPSPGPPGFFFGPWIQVHGGSIAGADIAAWPYSVGILCKFTCFLGTLHWPMGSENMGHFWVSFLELLIPFEQWAGHRVPAALGGSRSSSSADGGIVGGSAHRQLQQQIAEQIGFIPVPRGRRGSASGGF